MKHGTRWLKFHPNKRTCRENAHDHQQDSPLRSNVQLHCLQDRLRGRESIPFVFGLKPASSRARERELGLDIKSMKCGGMKSSYQFLRNFRRFFHHYISYTFASPLLCALLRSPQVVVTVNQIKTSYSPYSKALSGTSCDQVGGVSVEKPSKHTLTGLCARTSLYT